MSRQAQVHSALDHPPLPCALPRACPEEAGAWDQALKWIVSHTSRRKDVKKLEACKAEHERLVESITERTGGIQLGGGGGNGREAKPR